MKHILLTLALAGSTLAATAQKPSKAARHWVDSTFKKLSPRERIAQLMIVRAHSNLGPAHVAHVDSLIRELNVGALCFFQGGPVRQALLTNHFQAGARTPLLVTMDAEWGLAMRLDSVERYPYQISLGALPNEGTVYKLGGAIGRQLKRIGVHLNYAPVVDVNNNPNNPVIGFRSFGEDKEAVARMGVAYTRGMQEAGVMACAKHFPGHGDVAVDSHYDLPVINKPTESLDSLELYPFKELFKAKVGSVMIAHLAIPAIDTTTNLPTSLSRNNVNGLLRKELDYTGLSITDGLEMKGVTKYFSTGEIAVRAMEAGNDLLCLPEDVPGAIAAIEQAISGKRLKKKTIEERVKKVLHAKYALGLHNPQVIDTTNIWADLNRETVAINNEVARNSVTVLRNDAGLLPLSARRIAYVAIGATQENELMRRLRTEARADVFSFGFRRDSLAADSLARAVKAGKYDAVLVGVHEYNPRLANNFQISRSALALWNGLQGPQTATLLFGNVMAAKNFCGAPTLVAFHQDDSVNGAAAADFLMGRLPAIGKLAVTVCDLPFGTSVPVTRLEPAGSSAAWAPVDSIVREGLARRAYPGAVILAVQNGEVKYHKAFGRYSYDTLSQPVHLESIYDLASITKTSATTVGLMKLYDEGRISLDGTLGDYLPAARGTDKAGLKLRDILLHQAGLAAGIPLYPETLDPATKQPSERYYRTAPSDSFNIPVARDLWLRSDWADSMVVKILNSRLGTTKYLYSDLDFILLGKVVEAVSGKRLDQYLHETYYKPMGMRTTVFQPFNRFGGERTVPTEQDNYFRRQLLRGYVHDENAALFGGVSGHAGLFSNAFDLSLLYQMLLNGGTFGGKRYLKPETVQLFTAYGSGSSRRGLGFDKPEKDNEKRKEPYPGTYASPETFGHTGFTGTAVWADPKTNLVYIFLSNRVNGGRNNLLGELNIRGKVLDAIHRALQQEGK
ncbi:glycoside hydrolase family 3 N-terminal domain-containing protein [Flaviaesturariibacter amylovorans]|uniref:beta-N-acetylhexosaminidase n=1 Tax=Flaviaesturariibacter amylovorans TaxID=1084520 RepID=A0ABP8GA36_9BACT